uniref:ATP synthase F0 subunit 8 n=1 Tax=Garjajewia cabanisii TaxID=686703 RepID=A0A1L5BW95_9CRUS|nr:ATP synthase F0 subunit 8 [Garjajewia cabanisii]
MPQMAPIMWLPLFILIILLVLLSKFSIYFLSNKTLIKGHSGKITFSANLLW